MARPKSIVTRDQSVKVRLTPLEKESMKIMAERTGLSLSQYVLRCAFGKEVHVRFSEEELSLYKTLHAYHSNFKHIGNLYSSRGKDEELRREVCLVLEELKIHLKRFK